MGSVRSRPQDERCRSRPVSPALYFDEFFGAVVSMTIPCADRHIYWVCVFPSRPDFH